MKKHIFFLVLTTLFLFTFSSAEAQKKYNRKDDSNFGLGVKAGINYASQSTSSGAANVDVTSVIRMNGGVYVNYFFFDFLAVQPELMLSGKGLHWKDQFSNAEDILTYIDMPILIKYQPVKLLNIHAGPEFGYRLNATQKNLDNGQKTDIKDFYSNFDFGLAFGVEANLPFKVNLTFRYVLGLNTVYTGTENNEQWKNNYFQISAGYRIFGK
jgi:hypothetical protein